MKTGWIFLVLRTKNTQPRLLLTVIPRKTNKTNLLFVEKTRKLEMID